MAEGSRMWAKFLLTTMLLLPLLSAAPLDISGKNTKVDVKPDNDRMHSHDENVTRGGKFFGHNQFNIRNIDVSGSISADDVSIGHKVKIDVYEQTQDNHEAGSVSDSTASDEVDVLETHDHHETDSVYDSVSSDDIREAPPVFDISNTSNTDEAKESNPVVFFNSIDSDKNRLIDAKELITVFEQNNIYIAEYLAQKIITLPDKTVGFNMDKFLELMKDCPSTNSADQVGFLLHAAGSLDNGEFDNYLQNVFLALDTDHDCKLFANDIISFFSDMGSDISLYEAKSLLAVENVRGGGLDLEQWKQIILKEFFKTKDQAFLWKKAFSKVEESIQTGGVSLRTEDTSVQEAAIFTANLLGECSHGELIKVESASVKVVEGLQYEFKLSLATMGGDDCKDKIFKVCDNIVVFKPLPEDCNGAGPLKLINSTCNTRISKAETQTNIRAIGEFKETLQTIDDELKIMVKVGGKTAANNLNRDEKNIGTLIQSINILSGYEKNLVELIKNLAGNENLFEKNTQAIKNFTGNEMKLFEIIFQAIKNFTGDEMKLFKIFEIFIQAIKNFSGDENKLFEIISPAIKIFAGNAKNLLKIITQAIKNFTGDEKKLFQIITHGVTLFFRVWNMQFKNPDDIRAEMLFSFYRTWNTQFNNPRKSKSNVDDIKTLDPCAEGSQLDCETGACNAEQIEDVIKASKSCFNKIKTTGTVTPEFQQSFFEVRKIVDAVTEKVEGTEKAKLTEIAGNWGKWSDWSDVDTCSRECGGGKQQRKKLRYCKSPSGCQGESTQIELKDCNKDTCELKCSDKGTVVVADFCSKFPQEMSSEDLQRFYTKYREETRIFCTFDTEKKREALLFCKRITPAIAEVLLKTSDQDSDCNYVQTEILDGYCGQLILDKVSNSCDETCQTKRTDVQTDIDKVTKEIDIVYEEQIEFQEVMEHLTLRQKELLEYQNNYEKQEIKRKQAEFRKEVLEKIDNAKLSQDKKQKIKEETSNKLNDDVVRTKTIANANSDLKSEKKKTHEMRNALNKVKKKFGKVKKYLAATDMAIFQKTSVATGHILRSIKKFNKGGTSNIIGGVLDIAAGVGQFMPPPTGIITESISSIFSMIQGSGAPSIASTQLLIKDEFNKQKEWMKKKFDEIDEQFVDLSNKIDEANKKIEDKLEKNLDDLKRELEKMENKRREMQLMDAVSEKTRDAMSQWGALQIKLGFIIDNENIEHTEESYSYIVTSMDIFGIESEKIEFRAFVKDKCKAKKHIETRKYCQALAFATLMMDRISEIIITKTIVLIKQSNLKTLDFTLALERKKGVAYDFFTEIFANTEEVNFSYISCGLSDKSHAKLRYDQKKILLDYAEHLEQDFGQGLPNKLKKRDLCVDASYREEWLPVHGDDITFIKKIRECCKKGKKTQKKLCSPQKSETYGGVYCDPSVKLRCEGFLTIGYCTDGRQNEIIRGTVLEQGNVMMSQNGEFKLVMQSDGNLVLSTVRDNKPYWTTKTDVHRVKTKDCPGCTFHFQLDGNLVLHDHVTGVWYSNTNEKAVDTLADTLTLRYDGMLVLTKDKKDIFHVPTGHVLHDIAKTSMINFDASYPGTWDKWGNIEKCSYPYFVNKMNLKFKRGLYGTFSESVYAIELTCTDETTISSTEIESGDYRWGVKTCPAKSFINGAQINRGKTYSYYGHYGVSDINGVRFKCNDESELKHGHGPWEYWSEWKYCEEGSAVYGIQTKISGRQIMMAIDENLTDVKFFCAKLPREANTCTTDKGACIFPFTYKGKTYNGCTKVNHNRAWCATKEDQTGSWWGNCPSTCKMHYSGYVSLGCWKDTSNRAIATLEESDGRLAGNYKERKNAVELCFEVAKSKGYPAFAVQDGGQCFASSTALETYKKYGAASNCVNGKGGGWANDVYKIAG